MGEECTSQVVLYTHKTRDSSFPPCCCLANRVLQQLVARVRRALVRCRGAGRGGGRQSSSCCFYSFWRRHRYLVSSGETGETFQCLIFRFLCQEKRFEKISSHVHSVYGWYVTKSRRVSLWVNMTVILAMEEERAEDNRARTVVWPWAGIHRDSWLVGCEERLSPLWSRLGL